MARLLNADLDTRSGDRGPHTRKKVRVGTSLQCVALLFLTIFLLGSASAQITITATDVGSWLAIGKTVTGRSDTATKTANIGVPGATSWDFSALKSNFVSTATIVRPDTTPFFAYFPGSTQAERVGASGGLAYEYLALGTTLLIQGTGVTGTFPARIRNVPSEIFYQLPMTIGTTWTSAYVESTMVTLPPPVGPQVTVTNRTVSNTVDAYGSLTLPGGSVVQAVRLRTDMRSTSKSTSVRTISYAILAANGASVTVSAADSLQPNSGTIRASAISWSNAVASDVRLSDAVPASFALSQNYPNPFNPTTKIKFSVPSGRDLVRRADGQIPNSNPVSLKVYNLLGEEVRTLVDGNLEPGSYEATFDATGLASGVYFYRLETGTFTDTKRLLLLR